MDRLQGYAQRVNLLTIRHSINRGRCCSQTCWSIMQLEVFLFLDYSCWIRYILLFLLQLVSSSSTALSIVIISTFRKLSWSHWNKALRWTASSSKKKSMHKVLHLLLHYIISLALTIPYPMISCESWRKTDQRTFIKIWSSSSLLRTT